MGDIGEEFSHNEGNEGTGDWSALNTSLGKGKRRSDRTLFAVDFTAA